MTQYLRPSSDINTGWACSTGSARYALIDEEEANDSDYIDTSTLNQTQECKLSAGNTPNVRTGHSIKFRGRQTTVTTGINIVLLQGTTTIKTQSQSFTSSYATYTVNLTEAEANNITNYTDLRLRFICNAGCETRITWAVFEVPDQVLSTDLCIGCAF